MERGREKRLPDGTPQRSGGSIDPECRRPPARNALFYSFTTQSPSSLFSRFYPLSLPSTGSPLSPRVSLFPYFVSLFPPFVSVLAPTLLPFYLTSFLILYPVFLVTPIHLYFTFISINLSLFLAFIDFNPLAFFLVSDLPFYPCFISSPLFLYPP